MGKNSLILSLITCLSINSAEVSKSSSLNTITAITDSNKILQKSELIKLDKALTKIFQPLLVRVIISEYLANKKEDMGLNLPQFFENINITERNVLKSLIDPTLQKAIYLKAIKDIAQRIYETRIREIYMAGDKKKSWGQNFACEPEVLSYIMPYVRNKIVLEIGGASGEHSIMFAFAGAKKVYLNDISPIEIKSFLSLKSNLPENISKKLEAIEGSCFDSLNREDLLGKVDIIICRNLIHFFSDEKRDSFFKIIKQLLKPNGYVVFNVNPIYIVPEFKALCEKHPDATSFCSIHCLLTDYLQGPTPWERIFFDVDICADYLIETKSYRNYYIYEKDRKTDYKWQANKNDFNKLEKSLREKIRKACQENWELIKTMHAGSVRVLKSWSRGYSFKNLSNLFVKNGFEIIQTFAVDKKGHLIHDLDDSNFFDKNIQQIGAIIRNSEIDVTKI